MKAHNLRHIKSGVQYDDLFPKSTGMDTVIQPQGEAKLHHTINLIKRIVNDTTRDTHLLSKVLKKKNLKSTCESIWNFVYQHIQYAKDKAGVEQVRRPARTWRDRKTGVDCDCYTVFISSILQNIGIPHRFRITKYNGKSHFQHIYPIVPTGQGNHITIDCVTDQFDHEVPFSGVKDFDPKDKSYVGEINESEEVSGVDFLGISPIGELSKNTLMLVTFSILNFSTLFLNQLTELIS